MICHIEAYLNGRWQVAATFEPYPATVERGVEGPCRLQYDVDYAVANLDNPRAEIVPGLKVGFELFQFETWPAFLVDLLPSGAGRRAWLQRLQVPGDGPHLDWHMLTKGAGNPPGHLRIAEAVLPPPPDQFRAGFTRLDILEQQENFLEYAAERGAHVAGASSVQGEAPKYLLVEDLNGMFHAEGALPDERISRFWLVKFPRGKRSNPRNRKVLKNEAPYLEVARRFGIRTGAPLEYQNDTLFVPRFDRAVQSGRVVRHGMHSLYALADIPGFGAAVHHEIYCQALARVATDPVAELREYLLRDILNLALRNTDNHGRNSAILRQADKIALSPVFDFAPMFLDPEGISRVTRWQDEVPGNQPEWGAIAERLRYGLDPQETRDWLSSQAEKVRTLPDIMHDCRVDDDIIERLAGWIGEVAGGLDAARARTVQGGTP